MLPGRGAAGVDGPGNHHWSHLSKWSWVAVWGGSWWGVPPCPPAGGLRPSGATSKEKKPGPPPADRRTREIERDGLSPRQIVIAAML